MWSSSTKATRKDISLTKSGNPKGSHEVGLKGYSKSSDGRGSTVVWGKEGKLTLQFRLPEIHE